jgi:lysophospholipase L1-like esterase
MMFRGPRKRRPAHGVHVGLLSLACALGSPAEARTKPHPIAKAIPVAVSSQPPLPRATSPSQASSVKALASFHRALDLTRRMESKTHVLFFGDSHTASDCMTGRLRERLQAEYGDGGPGFLMVGKPWAYYFHGRAQVVESLGLHAVFVRKRPEAGLQPLGLSGVAFTGGDLDPVSVRLGVLGALVPTGRRLHTELLFLKQPEGATLELFLDDQPLGSVVTAGEPGPGYVAFDVPDDGRHEIALRAPAEVPVALLGLVAELEGTGVVVDTLGVPGARARAQLFWDPSLFREHVNRRAPDLWILAYGTNESTDATQPIEEYALRLRQVIANLRAAAPNASCLLVGPPDFPERTKKRVYQERERTTHINQTQRAVAAALGCAFFDTIAMMGGPLSMLDWAKRDPPLGARDMVHLTAAGYAVLGDAIADTILPAVTQLPTPAPRDFGLH